MWIRRCGNREVGEVVEGGTSVAEVEEEGSRDLSVYAVGGWRSRRFRVGAGARLRSGWWGGGAGHCCVQLKELQ